MRNVCQTIQTSTIEAGLGTGPGGKLNRRSSITGQGIHTDGSCCAGLFCIERYNVNGAMNSFHQNLDGSQQLCQPTSLEPGQAVYFKDDSIYHYVSPAFPQDATQKMQRSVLVMNYPADFALNGSKNQKNSLSGNESSIKLRACVRFKNHRFIHYHGHYRNDHHCNCSHWTLDPQQLLSGCQPQWTSCSRRATKDFRSLFNSLDFRSLLSSAYSSIC